MCVYEWIIFDNSELCPIHQLADLKFFKHLYFHPEALPPCQSSQGVFVPVMEKDVGLHESLCVRVSDGLKKLS